MENIKLYEYYNQSKFIPTAFDIFSEDAFRVHKSKRDNLYIEKLKLLPQIWKDAEVLEIGCGSGENSVIPAQYGAKFHFVEPLKPALERLKKIFHYYNVQHAIKGIDSTPLEELNIDRTYDIIIAEGFVFTLKDRKKAMVKMFTHLKPGGLLIFSTIDPHGFFLEYFKGLIARMHCSELNISEPGEKVEAVRPFFEEDFKRIPHSRPFSSYVRDNFFNPLSQSYKQFCYGFDQVISHLKEYTPYYYASWPSYKHANDLKWHKYVPTYEEHINGVLEGYRYRLPSFITGEHLTEKETIKRLLAAETETIIQKVEEIMDRIYDVISGKRSLPQLIETIKNAKAIGKELTEEMTAVLENLTPETYLKCKQLRRFWGVPYHYIVLRRTN
ncbi:MAG: class I SAM-dependent methyltransferase [bacterium]|nr:class I SAM-dependent methyltransferase [bacterium]